MLTESGKREDGAFQSPSGVLGVCREFIIMPFAEGQAGGFSPLPGF